MNSNNEYTLNFAIPKGQTGPSSFDSVIYTYFQTQTQNGTLVTSRVIAFPKNQNIFHIDKTNYQINTTQAGYYTFTISGCLKKTGTSNPILKLQLITNNTVEDLIIVPLSSKQQLYFAQTQMKYCDENTIIQPVFQKANDANASIENANFIIKKIIF